MEYVFNVGQAFKNRAALAAERPAIVYPGGPTITYRDLDVLSDRVAALFLRRRIRRYDVVGIVHSKTVLCYAAMLAALKIGAIYVNLDDQNPPPRLAHIFATARPALVVGHTPSHAIVEAAQGQGPSVIDLDREAIDEPSAHDADALSAALDAVNGADPAYVMYTSGSTGVPKGALIAHAGVLNFGSWVGERFEVSPNDRFTNVNPMYFDNSVFDFYGALLNGAAVVPIGRDALTDGARVLREVEAAGATIWFSVPSMLVFLNTMKLLSPERLPAIRTFVFGGEGFPKPSLRRLFETYGRRSRLINVYGPTECTCICSAWDVGADDLASDDGFVTLGPVCENFSMVVLDGDERVGAEGVGELCLLGPQVGLGYINDPERTAKAFTRNPLNQSWGQWMYRTGDLVRIDRDGRKLHFVARADNQIKHMGYRIELEEIEAAINSIEGVAECVVVQRRGIRDSSMLVAVVAGTGLTEEGLRTALGSLLPPYMIPQRFEQQAALPKNANGKIDRVAVREALRGA